LKDGTITEMLPYELINDKIIPVYKEIKGWRVPLTGISEDNLPSELMDYVSFLEQHLGVPITIISTGPDRKHTIHRQAVVN
jgi:adenylosuccinate synthase